MAHRAFSLPTVQHAILCLPCALLRRAFPRTAGVVRLPLMPHFVQQAEMLQQCPRPWRRDQCRCGVSRSTHRPVQACVMRYAQLSRRCSRLSLWHWLGAILPDGPCDREYLAAYESASLLTPCSGTVHASSQYDGSRPIVNGDTDRPKSSARLGRGGPKERDKCDGGGTVGTRAIHRC